VILLSCSSLQQNIPNKKTLTKSSYHNLFLTISDYWYTYTVCRFGKEPMLDERVPDIFWLGIPLTNKKKLKNIKR
jgi:hypothetical protein